MYLNNIKRKDARIGIGDYFHFKDMARPHQALGYRTQGDYLLQSPL
jgi:hypothetical protein